MSGRTADSVTVILDHEHDRQLLFLREADGFEKVALSRRSIADGCDDEIRFAIKFNAPGDAAGGQKLRTGGSRHTPDVAIRVTIMRGHLTAAALALALCHIIKGQLS